MLDPENCIVLYSNRFLVFHEWITLLSGGGRGRNHALFLLLWDVKDEMEWNALE